MSDLSTSDSLNVAVMQSIVYRGLKPRFWKHVNKNGPMSATCAPGFGNCWDWTGAKDAAGYGQLSVNSKLEKAHHVAWFLEHGSFPKYLMHVCDRTSCVRPTHLEEGTQTANNYDRDMKAKGAVRRHGGKSAAYNTPPQSFSLNPLKTRHVPRKQKGQKIETRSAFFLRYYVTTTDETGAPVRKQECVKLADKSDMYRSWKDVELLAANVMDNVNLEADVPTGQMTLDVFVTKHYLPWAELNKAAATVNGYKQLWNRYLSPDLGKLAMVNLQTVHVTSVLTKHAEAGKGSRTLSHIKWMLSGVYQYAIAKGVVPTGANPAEHAQWMRKVHRVAETAVYPLERVIKMLQVLEPVDLRAAVAVALAYFAALRPAEIRGLKWDDYNGNELYIKRSIWRNHVGETKTEASEAAVFVIEPLRSLLEKLRVIDGQGYILKNSKNKPVSLDSLSGRV
ncbi:MAG: HNH endonuclease, partial [Terriglobales bacterium]